MPHYTVRDVRVRWETEHRTTLQETLVAPGTTGLSCLPCHSVPRSESGRSQLPSFRVVFWEALPAPERS